MPIYEYKCEDCGVEFEEMLHWSEKDIPIDAPCTKCEGKIHLKMSMSSFQLKGQGWYKDGYGLKQKQEETTTTTPPKTSDGVTKARSLIDD